MTYNYVKYVGLIIIVSIGVVACASSGGVSMSSNKVTKAGVTIEYVNCERVGSDLQCNLFLTADGRDTTVGISSGKSTAYDDAGNKYLPQLINIADENATGNVYTPKFTKVLADIKTQLTFVFENISTKAKEVKRLEVSISTRKPERYDNLLVSFNGNQI